MEPFPEISDSHEIAAVVAVGDPEGIAIDPVDGILKEIESQVAGGLPVHGNRPACFGMTRDGRKAGEADGVVASCGELCEEALISGVVAFIRPDFVGGGEASDDGELVGPGSDGGIGAEVRFEVGRLHGGSVADVRTVWNSITTWEGENIGEKP